MKTLLLLLFVVSAAAAEVRVERVPENGVQPQMAQGADGTVHLVYLKGEPRGCDVRYSTRKPGEKDWSKPVTVNSARASAIAMGTIRGAQLALGKDNMVHVVWNGPGSKSVPAPLNYAHSTSSGFTKQRDVRGDTVALDGGASIAADAKGGVFVFWHGAKKDSTPGEPNRVVFVLRSQNNGDSFNAPQVANLDYAGVCACCSLKSFVTPSGELMALYRAARSMGQRDITLLRSRDGGATFEHRVVGTWAIAACPMSSMTMMSSGKQTRGVWEAEGAIQTALLDEQSDAVTLGKGRHPALTLNSKGESLIAWSVGTGWQKGGSLEWRVVDANGKPTAQQGAERGIPVWDFSAAYADGENFVIVY